MKNFIVFTLIIAGINALPPQLTKGLLTSDERLITDSIASTIEELSQSIRDAGLDPLHIPHEEASYELPVPALFNFHGQIEEFLFNGLSGMQITTLTFTTLTLRLRLGMRLPLLKATMDNAEMNAGFFGEKVNFSASGSLAIRDIAVETDMRMRLGIISGISLNSIIASFKVGAIESDLAVYGFGRKMSTFVNHLLGTIIPEKLNEFEGDINELLEIVLFDIINDIL